MMKAKAAGKLLVILLAGAALYVGVTQGEWSEVLFNATLL